MSSRCQRSGGTSSSGRVETIVAGAAVAAAVPAVVAAVVPLAVLTAETMTVTTIVIEGLVCLIYIFDVRKLSGHVVGATLRAFLSASGANMFVGE